MFSPLSPGLCGYVPFFLNAWEGKGPAGGRVVSESDRVTFPPAPRFLGSGVEPRPNQCAGYTCILCLTDPLTGLSDSVNFLSCTREAQSCGVTRER